jgi:hypothetical protein
MPSSYMPQLDIKYPDAGQAMNTGFKNAMMVEQMGAYKQEQADTQGFKNALSSYVQTEDPEQKKNALMNMYKSMPEQTNKFMTSLHQQTVITEAEKKAQEAARDVKIKKLAGSGMQFIGMPLEQKAQLYPQLLQQLEETMPGAAQKMGLSPQYTPDVDVKIKMYAGQVISPTEQFKAGQATYKQFDTGEGGTGVFKTTKAGGLEQVHGLGKSGSKVKMWNPKTQLEQEVWPENVASLKAQGYTEGAPKAAPSAGANKETVYMLDPETGKGKKFTEAEAAELEKKGFLRGEEPHGGVTTDFAYRRLREAAGSEEAFEEARKVYVDAWRKGKGNNLAYDEAATFLGRKKSLARLAPLHEKYSSPDKIVEALKKKTITRKQAEDLLEEFHQDVLGGGE